MSQPAAPTLCRLDAIGESDSIGLLADVDGRRLPILLIRKDGAVVAYVNSCPHTGAPLDFQPGKFLDPSRTLILCSTHGALFRIADGYCVKGPCAGKSLRPVAIRVADGAVRLVTKAHAGSAG